MEHVSSHTSNALHLRLSAIISVALVIIIAGWQIRSMIDAKNTDLQAVAQTPKTVRALPADELAANLGISSPAATSSTADEIAYIGTSTIGTLAASYAVLAQDNAYTPEIGAQIAASVAPAVDARVPYATYDPQSIPTDPNTSYKRKLAYRAALQTSLSPLKKNAAYELDLYNTYMQTHDGASLAQLKNAARHYHDAAALTAKVVAPADAVSVQVGILDAMQEFGTTLDFIVDNINNPVTSLALLRAYNKAENDMFASFTALNAYYARK